MSFPKEFPTYPTKNQFIHYLESYAHHFNLKPGFNECVESAHYDKICGMWRIRTENKFAGEETEYICRWLIVATGENHFHHHKEEENQNLTPYEKAMKDEKKHKRMEHLGELGAVAAGTFALVLYISLSS